MTGVGDNKPGIEDVGEAEKVDNGDSDNICKGFEAVRPFGVVTLDWRAASVLGRKLFGVFIRNAARPFVADTD